MGSSWTPTATTRTRAPEAFYLRPGILKVFGWNVAFVLSSDWYQDPDKIMERLLGTFRG